MGGIGIPLMTVLAATARAAFLLVAHRSGSTTDTIDKHIDQEQELLFSVIQPHLDSPVRMYFSELTHAPEGRNPKRVAKSVCATIHSCLQRQIRTRLGDLSQSRIGIEHSRWVHKGDQPMIGLCFRIWPSAAPYRIPNSHMRRTIHRVLGLSVPDAPTTCQRALPTGEPCGMPLDAVGHHAYLCCRHLMRARHDAIRDHLAQYIRSAGLYCMTEQRTSQEIRAQEGAEASEVTWKRPKRTADIHTVDKSGADIYGDVRVYSLCPGEAVEQTLKQQEVTKCAEYGLGPPPSAEPVHGVCPLVFELAGAVSRSCLGFCRYMIWHHANKSSLQHALDRGAAWRRAAHALWAPIAVILLRTRCQAELACV